SGAIKNLAAAGLPPRIKLCLKVVALGEQRSVSRAEVNKQKFEIAPKRVPFNAGSGQRFRIDEVVQFSSDRKRSARNAFGHVNASWWRSTMVARRNENRPQSPRPAHSARARSR